MNQNNEVPDGTDNEQKPEPPRPVCEQDRAHNSGSLLAQELQDMFRPAEEQ